MKLSHKELYYFCVIFALATPIIFFNIESSLITGMVRCEKYVVFLLVFIRWLNHRRTSLFLLLHAGIYGCILISTILNHGSLFACINEAAANIVTVMFIETERDDILSVWRVCIAFLGTMILLECICIMLFPEGMVEGVIEFGSQTRPIQPTWIFANKNGLGKNILYLLFFLMNYMEQKHRSDDWITAAMFLVGFVAVARARSMTSVLLVGIMGIMLCFTRMLQRKKPKLFNVYLFGCSILFVFVNIMILNNIERFQNALRNILHKSSTFGGRSPIWQEAVRRIGERPLFGYGYLSGAQFRELIGSSAATNAHNMPLTFAVYGGLAAALFFALLTVYCFRSVRGIQYSHTGIILTTFLFVFFTMMLFEHTTSRLYWFILYFAVMQSDRFEGRMLRLM